MSYKFGPPFKKTKGFTMHEILVRERDGSYYLTGFAIFNPDKEIVASLPTYEKALAVLDYFTEPSLSLSAA